MSEDLSSAGTDDPMERIRAVFEEPYPSLPIPPGTWERIETEARRRRRTRRLQVVGSVAASLLVVGAGVGLLWPQQQPKAPGIGQVGSSGSSTGTPSTGPSTPAPSVPAPSRTSPDPTVPPGPLADGLPKGGPVPKSFVPSSFSAGVADSGGRYLYVLGDAPGCGNPVCTSMVRSSDGGRSWKGIHAPEAEVGGDNPDAVREIRFASALDGYAFGPTLFETHDGGDTWTRRPMADSVLDLAVLNDRIWVVTASCDGNGCSSAQLMSAPATGGPLEPEPGVTIAGPVTSARLADGGGTLTLRTDGQEGTGEWVWQRGSGWRQLTQPCAVVTDVALQLVGLAPAADGSGRLAALCAGDSGTGDRVAVVTTSSNSGRTWTAGGLQRVPSGWLLLAVADQDRMVVVGAPDGTAPAVLASQDAGVTWAPPTGDVPPGGFRWLGAGGGGTVYALDGADGLLYTSRDGGATFGSRPIA